MKDLVKLRAERGELVDQRKQLADQMQGVLDAAGEEDLSEDQVKEFDGLNTKAVELGERIEALDKSIERAESVQRIKAEKAVPAEPQNQGGQPGGTPRVEVRTAEPEVKGATFAKITRALAAAKGIVPVACQVSASMFGEEHAATRALAAGVGSSGGFVVPEQYSAEIIELLRARAVVRRSGAVVMPMAGTLLVPKITSGSSASYVGENQNIAKTEPRFGQLRLTSRKLAAIVPISNDLLRTSNPAADGVVLNDLVAGMANTEDAAFLRADGMGNAPKGMYHWAHGDNRTGSAGATLANIETDIKFCLRALLDHDVRMIRPTWMMAPRSRIYLEFLRDDNGNLAFPEVGDRKQLKGFPLEESNNIPTNLGGGTESELYLVDMADAVIGEEAGIELMVSDTAAYHDGSQVVAAFSQDQTVIRAIAKHDFCMRHDRSVAVITGVTWGV